MSVVLSVICPAWNRHKVIKRCVDSVSRQTFTDFELIIVDDGSAPAIELGALGARCTAVRLVSHKENLGPAAARNGGARVAKGHWLAFIDSDDEWSPEKLERQMAFAESHASSARYQAFVTGFELVDPFLARTFRCIPNGASSMSEFASGCWFGPGTTLLIRREIFFALGGFDENLLRLEDYEFFIRFGAAHGALLVVPEILSRIHLQDSPPLDRLLSSTEYIHQKYLKSNFADYNVKRRIAAFCRLAKASSCYRNGLHAATLWHLAASWVLVPRRSIHLIDRFATKCVRSC
jgi:glycosyltransferase involved in cell wall biosynthesis